MRRNKLGILGLALLVAPVLGGCNNSRLTEIAPYLYEVETYTKLDYKYANNYYATENDNWSGGGCSCITKMIEGDRRIIGRNMDLNISENCAYVVRTAVPEKFKTIGLQYTFRDVSPKYEDVKKNGISRKWHKLLPFYQDDVMNEKGFHIEVNMRHGEYAAQGQDLFAVESTNPNGSMRVHMFELPIYIAQNCETIAQAKEYVASLDIYSKNNYWNYCFVMADSTGKASLLEFSNDPMGTEESPIHWIDEDKISQTDFSYMKNGEYPLFEGLEYNAIAQTNFFVNKRAYMFQDTKSGFGRMKTMQMGIEGKVKGIKDVETKQDMYDLMKAVSYSNFYKNYEDCKANNFDPRSEQLGELGMLNSGFCMNPVYEDTFKELQNAYVSTVQPLSRAEKRAANEFWESTFTEVVDLKDKSIFVRVFEDSNMEYLLTFDGFTKVNGIQD